MIGGSDPAGGMVSLSCAVDLIGWSTRERYVARQSFGWTARMGDY